MDGHYLRPEDPAFCNPSCQSDTKSNFLAAQTQKCKFIQFYKCSISAFAFMTDKNWIIIGNVHFMSQLNIIMNTHKH